jgi:hypothetical protein
MGFDQREFLVVHIPYRLQNLDLFDCALQILVSDRDPDGSQQKLAHIIFDTGHNVSGSYGIFTSLAVETGLLASRAILEFLQGKSSYEDDVMITCFRKSNGAKLPSVSLADIAKCCPLDVPEEKILKALNFTKTAADKAVAHITLALPEPENGDVEFYRISCRTIRSAMERHLYKELDLPSPRRLCPS